MKKKLFLLLLIVALAAFVFTGCTPPAEGEGEGEGEGEIEGVVVEIDSAVELNGRTYVAKGNHKITVTFPSPVANAEVFITDCYGDYGKQPYYGTGNGSFVVLFPNEDKTVWEGSGKFSCTPCGSGTCLPDPSDCCASYVMVSAGECEGDTCINLPVIVDCDLPYACIEVSIDECPCEDCEVTFKSTKTSPDCAADKECCGDNCSGLAAWAIAIYNKNPFDKCCETTCYEPIWSASDTECPINVATDCLDGAGTDKQTAKKYWVIVSLADMVGNEVEYYAMLYIWYSGTTEEPVCELAVENYCADKLNCTCTSWASTALVDTGLCATISGKVKGAIGSCSPANNCCPY